MAIPYMDKGTGDPYLHCWCDSSEWVSRLHLNYRASLSFGGHKMDQQHPNMATLQRSTTHHLFTLHINVW